MPNFNRPLLSVFYLLVFLRHFASASRSQFRRWYPEFGFQFNTILHTNCTTELSTCLHAKKDHAHMDFFTGGSPTNELAQPVVNCILGYTSEFIKINTASAQVLLGLTPSMLAVLGPSTEETSLLSVAGRRPLLALLIAAGSPAVFPMHAFDNNDPIELLRDREGRKAPPLLKYKSALAVMVFEYLLVIAAISNIATISRDLGFQAVCSFAPHLTYLVLLWAFLILIIHGSGSIALFLRIRVNHEEKSSNRVLRWIRIQFTPFQEEGLISVKVVPETYWFLTFSWVTAILTVCYNIYRTLTFSSILFISVRDSVAVIGRYFVSVICCRMVLMYELAELRDFFNGPNVRGSEVALEHLGSNSESQTHIHAL